MLLEITSFFNGLRRQGQNFWLVPTLANFYDQTNTRVCFFWRWRLELLLCTFCFNIGLERLLQGRNLHVLFPFDLEPVLHVNSHSHGFSDNVWRLLIMDFFLVFFRLQKSRNLSRTHALAGLTSGNQGLSNPPQIGTGTGHKSHLPPGTHSSKHFQLKISPLR